MSLPLCLLVDDSAAILAYESAALSGHYALATASNGLEALECLRELEPHCVVLDLSMPEMDGEEVLAAMRDSNRLEAVPVVVVSAEHERAEKCLGRGANAVLHKPIRAQQLLALVDRLVEQAHQARWAGELAVLPVTGGELHLGLPVNNVRRVVWRPTCRALGFGPSYLNQMLNYHGTPVCVLELPYGISREYSRGPLEQKVVIVEVAELLLGIGVDDVDDPREVPPHDVTRRDDLAGGRYAPLEKLLLAVVTLDGALLPVLDPTSLLSGRLLAQLRTLVTNASAKNP